MKQSKLKDEVKMGRYFKTSDEFYKIYLPFFRRLLESPEVGAKLKDSKLSIRFSLSDPEVEITIDYRSSPEGKVICGQSELEGDIKVSTKCDSAHRLWLGKLPLMSAIMSREVTARGPMDKLKEFSTLFKPASEIYQNLLKDMGYEELLKA
ncbi:MAG: SCP2 sterol-binding domain-containing protein [candidate division KSB1 bacterium]|nr:SCP2 sterol-binding domain-containing protein [candidate division KSB1 bacterium]